MADIKKQGSDEALEDSSEITTPDLSMFMEDSEPETETVEVEETEEEETEDEETEEEESTEEESEEEEADEEEESDEGELDIESISADDKVDYLNQLYKSLDDDARREWLSGRDGRIGKDVGKFRKERALAIEERDEIKAKYEELLVKSTTSGNNEFASLITDEAIAEKEKIVSNDLAAIEKWLSSDEDYLDIGDKSYSAREVARWPAMYAKQLQMLENQKKTVDKLSQVKGKTKEVEDTLKDEYTWFDDPDSSEFESYQKLRKDPAWSKVLDYVPELASELPKVLAKYVSETRPVVKAKKGLRVKGTRKPKGDLGSSGGVDKTSGSKQDKALKAAAKRLALGQASEQDRLAMFM